MDNHKADTVNIKNSTGDSALTRFASPVNLPSVNRDRMLKLFCDIISIDSPSFGEREVCDFLTEELRSLGFEPSEDDCAAKIGGNCGHLYTYIEGSGALSKLPPILFCSHMDTVEPSRGKKAIVHEDGLITSDGTTVLGADDVGGLTAILEALRLIREAGLPHRPIELLFTAAEEPYCAGVAAFDFSHLKSREAYILDLTGPIGGAALEAPTLLSFTGTFKGRAAHAGFSPELGIHAIKTAALAVSRIRLGHVDELTTANIGKIEGGIAGNIVPDCCTLSGEVRSFDDARAVAVLDEMEAVMQAAAKETGAEFVMEKVRQVTAYKVLPEHPVVKRFEAACEAEQIPVKLCSTHGGSDNNHFAQHGVTGIVLATAMNDCHSLNEYSNVDELVRISRIVLRLMTAEA